MGEVSRGWLARYARGVVGVTWPNYVWSIDRHSVATDGRTMLAVADNGRQEDEGIPAGLSRPVGRVRVYLGAPDKPFAETTLERLLRFCDRIEYQFCENCKNWRVNLRHLCEHCDGSGWWWAEQTRPAWVGGILLDLDRLAYSLPTELEGERVTLARHTSDALAVTGPSWKVWVMGLKADHSSHQSKVYPTFHDDDVYLAMLHDPECRHMLHDWLLERGDPYAAVVRRQLEAAEVA